MEDMAQDGELGDQARTNTEDQFRLVFDPKALDAVVARMERNEAIASTFLTNEQLRIVALDLMMKELYDRLRGPGVVSTDSGDARPA
jgi:type I restriction enzyme R subunit